LRMPAIACNRRTIRGTLAVRSAILAVRRRRAVAARMRTLFNFLLGHKNPFAPFSAAEKHTPRHPQNQSSAIVLSRTTPSPFFDMLSGHDTPGEENEPMRGASTFRRSSQIFLWAFPFISGALFAFFPFNGWKPHIAVALGHAVLIGAAVWILDGDVVNSGDGRQRSV